MILEIAFNMVYGAAIIILVSLPFYIHYRVFKFYNMSLGAYYMIGSFSFYTFYSVEKFDFWLSITLTILSITPIIMLFEWLTSHLLGKKNTSSIGMMVTTLGIFMILQNIISIQFGDSTHSINISSLNKKINFVGIHTSTFRIATIIISILFTSLLYFYLKISLYGKQFRAYISNSFLIQVFGLNHKLFLTITVFFISFFSISSGILISLDVSISPQFGFNYLLYAIIAVVISSAKYNVLSIFLGAFVLSTFQNLSAYFFGYQWVDFFSYMLFILFLIFGSIPKFRFVSG